MDSFLQMKISADALSVQRVRMNTIASNLANANTTSSADGSGPYRRKDVILEATPVAFKDMFESYTDDLDDSEKATLESVRSVKVLNIVDDNKEPTKVFDPNHPDADKDGFVSYPNISVMEEMVNMISASRAYEANLSVMKTSKLMMDKAISMINM